jgi:hypothetical protein
MDNSAPRSGAVFVFVRQGGMWTQQAFIKASNAAAGSEFGRGVALSDDGALLAAGARHDTQSGAVYIFTRTGLTWTEQAYLKAPVQGTTDQFGETVALSSRGDRLLVGAAEEDSGTADPLDDSVTNSGAVYAFDRQGADWRFRAYLKAPVPGADDTFGAALAVAGNGNVLAVGAPNEDAATQDPSDNSALEAGAAYLFDWP